METSGSRSGGQFVSVKKQPEHTFAASHGELSMLLTCPCERGKSWHPLVFLPREDQDTRTPVRWGRSVQSDANRSASGDSALQGPAWYSSKIQAVISSPRCACVNLSHFCHRFQFGSDWQSHACRVCISVMVGTEDPCWLCKHP